MKAILLLLFIFVPFVYLVSNNAQGDVWMGYVIGCIWILFRFLIHS